MSLGAYRGWLLVALATALLFPLFRLGQLGPLDFWWWMAANQLLLLAAAYGFDGGARLALVNDLRMQVPRKVWVGLLTAVVLYGLFWLGNAALHRLLPLAAGGVQSLYALQGEASTLRVALLIGLLFGPAEELVWRGAIQRAFVERYGAARGLLVTTLFYAVAHIASGNPLLILAALVCGLFWGYLFQRTGSVLLVAVNHAVWSLAVYVLLPFPGMGK
jgi:membrane protease YdiL (CAAX protease family)